MYIMSNLCASCTIKCIRIYGVEYTSGAVAGQCGGQAVAPWQHLLSFTV